ncbi:expressed unknown protein [Seminavis robusta]|uniref:CRAL-TRIO domain-containing protein n=1 Tax=Seminavis robusta TaxID=568900 RepID=A0A9N8DMM6_9STRA|nr:expressed unknown protein [Seminavis robusta]|eukprot:Sro217_g089661.1  (289) ;mRNA; f:26564-27430
MNVNRDAETVQDAGEAEARDGDAIVPLLSYVSSRVTLTNEEHQWAVAIKNAIVQTGDFTLTDFWYAQLAIIDKDDTEAALERAHKMQHFLQENDIADNLEEGGFVVTELAKMLPGYLLGWSQTPDGHQTLVVDSSKLDLRKISSHSTGMRTFFGSMYYLHTALNPDFKALRQGTVVMLECEGISWHTHFDLDFIRKYWSGFGSAYPIHFHQFKLFHTGVFVNMATAVTRELLPRYLRRKVEYGCVSPLGRLDCLYAVPDLEASTDRFLARFKCTLQLRYANEASFKLM